MKKKIPFEYFCHSCGQLRLSFNEDLTECGNCGSADIIEGEVNSLDKSRLKKEFYAEDRKDNGE